MNPIICLSQCESTNSEILNYIAQHDCVSLYTACQTKGRGQYGNTWKSDSGENLSFSFAINSQLIALSDLAFNFHTALLTREFIAKLSGKPVEIKWPNDLIMNNKKVAGLLVEKFKINNQSYFVFGVGINLKQVDFGELKSAGSLYTQSGILFDIDDFAKQFHHFLSENIELGNEEEILINYNNHLFRKDKISVFELVNLRQNGIIRKVDSQGYLHIELENEGLKKFTYKQIKMLY